MLSIIKLFFICVLVVNTALLTVSCAKKNIEEAPEETVKSVKTIKQVLKDNTRELMALPGVVGTGQGLCDEKPCILVFVVKMTSELEKKIPKTLDGFTVRVEESGEFKALPRKSEI